MKRLTWSFKTFKSFNRCAQFNPPLFLPRALRYGAKRLLSAAGSPSSAKRVTRGAEDEGGGLNMLNNLNVLNEFTNLLFYPVFFPSARHDIQVFFRR